VRPESLKGLVSYLNVLDLQTLDMEVVIGKRLLHKRVTIAEWLFQKKGYNIQSRGDEILLGRASILAMRDEFTAY
jgi:hypothetical protein